MTARQAAGEFVRPPRLRAGDTVAVVSTSWGGPSVFPATFDRGLDTLRRVFGLTIREMPTARMAARELGANPRRRADTRRFRLLEPAVA